MKRELNGAKTIWRRNARSIRIRSERGWRRYGRAQGKWMGRRGRERWAGTSREKYGDVMDSWLSLEEGGRRRVPIWLVEGEQCGFIRLVCPISRVARRNKVGGRILVKSLYSQPNQKDSYPLHHTLERNKTSTRPFSLQSTRSRLPISRTCIFQAYIDGKPH